MAVQTSRPGDGQTLKRGARDLPGETRVAEINGYLRAMKMSDRPAGGVFDDVTEAAVRRFQWYVSTQHWRLRIPPGGAVLTGLIEPFSPNHAILSTGICDAATATELKLWAGGGWQPTTMLVRLALGRFSKLERSTGFTQLRYPDARPDELLVSEDFVDGMTAVDSAAVAANVVVRINQTFRNQAVPPRGAVVPAATRSQHLIGHAIDGNFFDGKTVATAAIMKIGKQSDAVKDFIARVKAGGLRWGGDFSPKDPIHFDLPIAARGEEYPMRLYFCQRGYHDQHPMRRI